MNREQLSNIIGGIDDRHIAEAFRYDPRRASASPERNVQMRTKRITTLALAAALLLSLGLVAYAVGSIHTARQQELRSDLKIDESGTSSYVEYNIPDEQAAGLVLLSAISDGEFQTVYVNVSPVTEEELARFPDTFHFAWKLNGSLLDGEEWWGVAAPRLNPDRSVTGRDATFAAILEDAYDAQTQTLTLRFEISDSMIEELRQRTGSESIVVTVSAWDSEAQAASGVGSVAEWLNAQDSFGSVSFHPTDRELRVFDFGPVLYHDAESGRELELVALELSPTGAVWRMRYENMEEIYARRDQEQLILWGDLETRLISETQIIFSDGEVFSMPGLLADPCENGAVNCYIGWERAIDIRDVQRIVLGDLVLWESR